MFEKFPSTHLVHGCSVPGKLTLPNPYLKPGVWNYQHWRTISGNM